MAVAFLCFTLAVCPSHREGPRHAIQPEPRGGHSELIEPTEPVALGRYLAGQRGWVGAQWDCLYALWNRESGWRVSNPNPTSQADGIPQANPASKMASAGADWRTNAGTQIAWGLGYIKARYGSPCGAYAHSNARGYY